MPKTRIEGEPVAQPIVKSYRFLTDTEKKHRIRLRKLVEQRAKNGKIPKINELRCMDCGSPAEAYDHYKGYDWENRYDVQPVCRNCNCARGRKRGEWASNGVRRKCKKIGPTMKDFHFESQKARRGIR